MKTKHNVLALAIVLLFSGCSNGNNSIFPWTKNRDLEIYDSLPSNILEFKGRYPAALYDPFLFSKSEDKILVVLREGEIGEYNTHTNEYSSLLKVNNQIFIQSSIELKNNKILILGELRLSKGSKPFSVIYDIRNSRLVETKNQPSNRHGFQANVIKDGRILITGGSYQLKPVVYAEIFDPSNLTFSKLNLLLSPRFNHSAISLNDGRTFLVGGYTGFSPADRQNKIESINSSLSSVKEVGTFKKKWPGLFNRLVELPQGKILILAGGGFLFDINTYSLDSLPEKPLCEVFSGDSTAEGNGDLSIIRSFGSAKIVAYNNSLIILPFRQSFPEPCTVASKFKLSDYQIDEIGRIDSRFNFQTLSAINHNQGIYIFMDGGVYKLKKGRL